MAMLKREDAVFMRDGEGKLLAQEVTLDGFEKEGITIKVVPLVKGDIDEMVAITDDKEKAAHIDKKIILQHCINPVFTEQDLKDLKPKIKSAIVTTIMSVSMGRVITDQNKTEILDGGDFLSK